VAWQLLTPYIAINGLLRLGDCDSRDGYLQHLELRQKSEDIAEAAGITGAVLDIENTAAVLWLYNLKG